jgi:hypothetical protein
MFSPLSSFSPLFLPFYVIRFGTLASDQLLTGHNLRIQLQEMLQGQDSKLSQLSDDFKPMSGDKVHVFSS